MLKGTVSSLLCVLYNKVMDMRNDADYSPVVTFGYEVVEEIAAKVGIFNQVVCDRIRFEADSLRGR